MNRLTAQVRSPVRSRRAHPAARRAQAGVTLIETTTVSAVLAVLTGLAAPAFDQNMQRRHLEGAATQLETDIHHTRMRRSWHSLGQVHEPPEVYVRPLGGKGPRRHRPTPLNRRARTRNSVRPATIR